MVRWNFSHRYPIARTWIDPRFPVFGALLSTFEQNSIDSIYIEFTVDPSGRVHKTPRSGRLNQGSDRVLIMSPTLSERPELIVSNWSHLLPSRFGSSSRIGSQSDPIGLPISILQIDPKGHIGWIEKGACQDVTSKK